MKENQHHLVRIDILRAIAIIAVFLYHAQDALFPGYRLAPGNILPLNFGDSRAMLLHFSPTAFGWTGVQLFLLISGFVIHLGYLRRPESFAIKAFYRRRFRRIYPPYLLVLLFICFFRNGWHYFLFTGKGLWDLLSHLLLIHNLSDTTFFEINASFWSLALEIQLYLLYPLILFLRKKTGMRNTFLIVLTVAALTMAAGLIVPGLQGHIAYQNSVPAFWCIWVAGAWLAEQYTADETLFGKWVLLMAVSGFLLMILSAGHSFGRYFTPYIAAFAWLAFFEWFLQTSVISTNSKWAKTLVTIGVCSYSIYLIHQPYLGSLLQYFTIYYHSENQSMVFALLKIIPAFAVIFLVAYSLYQFVEIPASKAGKRQEETDHKNGAA